MEPHTGPVIHEYIKKQRFKSGSLWKYKLTNVRKRKGFQKYEEKTVYRPNSYGIN